MKRSLNDSTLQANWVRINKAADFIEQNLDQDLSLDHLSKIACYSPFHFHRIFKEIYGETPYEFVTRKRIEKITWLMLKHKTVALHDLVYRYGFESASSFSRTFKKYYGTSAKEFRANSQSPYNKLSRNKSKIGKEKISVEQYFSNIKAVQKWMSQHARVDIKTLQEIKVIYLRKQGSFELADLTFENLRSWLQAKGRLGAEQAHWLMVIHDNPAFTEASKISYSASLEIKKNVPWGDEISSLTIPAGRFLVGSFEIPDSDFEKAWSGMSVWLMENDLMLRDGYYFESFHTDSIFQQGAFHKVDLCLPIE